MQRACRQVQKAESVLKEWCVEQWDVLAGHRQSSSSRCPVCNVPSSFGSFLKGLPFDTETHVPDSDIVSAKSHPEQEVGR